MSTQPNWITLTRAQGYPRWQIVEWAYHDPDDECNNGGVNVYMKALDESGKFKSGVNVFWATPDEAVKMQMRPEGDLDYCFDATGKTFYGVAAQMSGDSSFSPDRGEHGPYSAYMEGNSDKISGMGLPLKRHVQFTVVWQLKKEGDEPPPEKEEWIISKQTAKRIVLVRQTK